MCSCSQHDSWTLNFPTKAPTCRRLGCCMRHAARPALALGVQVVGHRAQLGDHSLKAGPRSDVLLPAGLHKRQVRRHPNKRTALGCGWVCWNFRPQALLSHPHHNLHSHTTSGV